MAETTNLGLTLLEAAQAQKHVTVNEGLTKIDEAIGPSVTSNGASTTLFAVEEELDLSASTETTIEFPNQCFITGCSLRVTEEIIGTHSSFSVGRTGVSTNEFGNLLNLTAVGSTNQGTVGTGNYSDSTVTITPTGGSFTSGKVRLTFHYIFNQPATS